MNICFWYFLWIIQYYSAFFLMNARSTQSRIRANTLQSERPSRKFSMQSSHHRLAFRFQFVENVQNICTDCGEPSPILTERTHKNRTNGYSCEGDLRTLFKIFWRKAFVGPRLKGGMAVQPSVQFYLKNTERMNFLGGKGGMRLFRLPDDGAAVS